MSDDLVERLECQAIEIAKEGHAGWGNSMTMAAEEIERLRAEVADWRKAFHKACDNRDKHYVEQQRAERERDALRARIEGAAVAWAGVAQNGLWHAGQDWRDSAHVKLHLSGFGDAEDQKSIKTCRVALVPVDE